MRKIIRTQPPSPRVTPEPFFHLLNKYFKESFAGKHRKDTKEIQDAIEFWQKMREEIKCNNCSECLYWKKQAWITDLDVNANDLCNLMALILREKLKKLGRGDIMDVPGLRLPGSACSKQ